MINLYLRGDDGSIGLNWILTGRFWQRLEIFDENVSSATTKLAADGQSLRLCPTRHPVGGNPRLASAIVVASLDCSVA